MYSKNCNKERIVEEICKKIRETENMMVLYKVKQAIEKESPIFIRDYIDKHWSEHSEGFKDDLEHEIRKFWIETSSGCHPEGYLISPISTELPECCWDITIGNRDADVWVMEKGTSFNPTDIAIALFNIYMGKIYF